MIADRIVLGTAALGTDSRDSAYRLLDTFIDLGGTTLDSAAIYSDWQPGESGRSETTIGDWLASRGTRDRMFIVTKGAHPLINESASRLNPVDIRHDVEQSLRRLRTDRIDQWLFHKDDGVAPVADVVGTLQDLQREGKILAFGSSNWSLARMQEAMAVPGEKFTANQVLGNIFAATMGTPADPTTVVIDAPMFRHARDNDLTLYLFTSTARGYFDNLARGVGPTPSFDNPATAAVAEKVVSIAAEQGVSPSDLMLAFLMHLGPNVRPVIGTIQPDHLKASWKAHDIALSPETVRRLAEAAHLTGFLD
jgi:aryl-alcohol dehydrogenase-like predicted oxidoreductase